MLEFVDSSQSLSPQELVSNTRENGRSLEHYQEILTQNRLPPFASDSGDVVLEIGTGLGNAVKGLVEISGPAGSVVSVDINSETLRIAYTNLRRSLETDENGFIVELLKACPSVIKQKSVFLIEGDISTSLELPTKTFSRALSIWVFYQIYDKLTALSRVLNSLKAQGSFHATALGSVAFCPGDISDENLAWLRERVWNTRASRFSWLTGTRELSYWSASRNIPMIVIDVPSALELLYPNVSVLSGTPEPGRPEGAMVVTRGNALFDYDSVAPPIGFVSTRSSSLIPIYKNRSVFEALQAKSGVSGPP